MDRATYRHLVASLEELSRRDPGRLRRRVYNFIAIGYGYVFLVIGGLLALLALLVWAIVSTRSAAWAGKLIVAVVALLALILRSLWVRTEPPQGTPLDLRTVPKLQERVEGIRRKLRSPRPAHVLLTEDFNASVTQVPRLGIFGFPSTYLILGLPLMYGLSPAEFDAVLAHEFAHLSGAHPKRGLWVYRMGRTWHQLMSQMEAAKSWGSVVFDRFVRWYVPLLDAYGFVMSRRDEYSADADAAQVTSPHSMGAALVALHARGGAFDEEMWRDIWSRAEREPEPPEQSWTTLPERLRAADAKPVRSVWVGRALQAPPSEYDTHPTLRERLQALGVLRGDGPGAADEALALLRPFERSAAEHYLGDLAPERLRALEHGWRTHVREEWRTQHQQAQAARAELAALEARDQAGEALDLDALSKLLVLTTRVHGTVEAMPLARRVLALKDDHANAQYVVGNGLLMQEDAAGIAHLERAMAIDPSATPMISNLLHGFHAARGDRDGIARVEANYDAWAAQVQAARAERENVTRQDTFVPAELTAADRELLARVLRRFDGFRTFYAVRKVTVHGPETPFIVLLAERTFWTFASGDNAQAAQDMIGHIRLEGNADVMLFIAASELGWLKKKMIAAGAVQVDRGD